MYGNIGKEAKKQKECCTFLLQCCGPLRVGKRGLQTLPRFCCWWLTIDYFFLPHFIIWFNILGQGVLWQDRGWVRQWRGGGLNLFLQSNFLRIYGQWYVFVSFTDGKPVASLSASDFFETKYTRVYMYIHEYIYYCKPFTKICSEFAQLIYQTESEMFWNEVEHCVAITQRGACLCSPIKVWSSQLGH